MKLCSSNLEKLLCPYSFLRYLKNWWQRKGSGTNERLMMKGGTYFATMRMRFSTYVVTTQDWYDIKCDEEVNIYL